MIDPQALTFALAYTTAFILLGYLSIDTWYTSVKNERKNNTWEHGHYTNEYGKGVKARRNPHSGRVQFVIWKAGEQGHTTDCWIDYHPSRWPDFIPHAGRHSDAQ